jgi:V/A-type H+-transporting ATPase subunit I
MCLTDAGYGLIVALLSFLALKKLPLGQGPKRLFSILFYTGLVTLPVGAVTGGYFGLDFSNFSPALQSIRNRLMLFNPLEGNGSIIFLGVCMAVGFVHVCFGLLLAFYDAVRKGKIVDGIYDQVSWLGLLIGLVLLGLGRPNLLGSTVATFGKWMALFSAGVIVLFGGRSSKNPIARIFTGLYSLYGITGYFGDILSYSRLMAMGMATGVIAMVINTMIGMIQDIPIVGVVLAALFFVVGHLFNILINMVSGFIHTMRLQFVEFFQKFLEGGGNPFKPLKQQYRYALIVDKEITQG